MEAIETTESVETVAPATPQRAEEGMYRVKDVAPLLGVCLATVYNLIARGDLPAFSIGPGFGAKRVLHSDLVAYLERCRARSVHSPS